MTDGNSVSFRIEAENLNPTDLYDVTVLIRVADAEIADIFAMINYKVKSTAAEEFEQTTACLYRLQLNRRDKLMLLEYLGQLNRRKSQYSACLPLQVTSVLTPFSWFKDEVLEVLFGRRRSSW